jgi:hypothetical protein
MDRGRQDSPGARSRVGGGLVLRDAPPTAPPKVPMEVALARAMALPVAASDMGRLIAAFLPLLIQGRPLYCLDGGNCFDPYRLAELARRQGLDPAMILERVFVSRAYTCHQLVEGARTLLTPLIEGPLGQARPPGEAPLAGILGIDRLFLDDDVPLFERRHLFERLLEQARRLRGAGLPLFLTFVGPRESPWAQRLAAEGRLRIESG